MAMLGKYCTFGKGGKVYYFDSLRFAKLKAMWFYYISGETSFVDKVYRTHNKCFLVYDKIDRKWIILFWFYRFSVFISISLFIFFLLMQGLDS